MSSYQQFHGLTEEELRARLSPLEYEVTQNGATEPPFRNRYYDHHEEGIYVDIVSGEPLFSSLDKFDSGTGWPSFSAPIEVGRVVALDDNSHGMHRVEVRSSLANSHLGHVFDDGPKPSGQRFCINSAALRFVALSHLEAEGYGSYLARFKEPSGKHIQVPRAINAAQACLEPTTVGKGCGATVEEAYLAGGCFWGMQDLLRKVPGVLSTEVGYAGGTTANPRYEDVRTGRTMHAETVRVLFDRTNLPFDVLLSDWFFRMHDPTTLNRQGNDRGTQYRSAIFYVNDEQAQIAKDVIARVQSSGRWKAPITTEVTSLRGFTVAEDYHQDYLVKHPDGYTCHFLRQF